MNTRKMQWPEPGVETEKVEKDMFEANNTFGLYGLRTSEAKEALAGAGLDTPLHSPYRG